jgi:uncharacterized membrane protein
MSLLDQGFSRTPADTDWQRGREAPAGGGASPDQGAQQQQKVNVGDGERMVSVAAGAIVGLLGLSRRSLPGLLMAGVGGAMVYRGATGHCHAYQALGIDTADDEQQRGERSEAEIAKRGIHVANSFLINRPAGELYRFWRNFENLPQIMTHLDSVRTIDERRSHWVARLPKIAGGKTLEWDAQVTRDDPDSLIAWQSLPGSDIDTAGQVRFEPAMGDRGTLVHAFMNYVPPGGMLTMLLAPLLNKGSFRLIREDMRNFKRIMEVGEIPTIIGQPHGTCTGQGELYAEKAW